MHGHVDDHSTQDLGRTDLVFANDLPPYLNGLLDQRILFFDPAFTYFTVYARTTSEIAVNNLLWRCVQDSSFPSTAWRCFAKEATSTLIALAIPHPLKQFLEYATLEEMHESILVMLVDAAQGEDDDGLAKMRTELAATVWDQVADRLARISTFASKQTSMRSHATSHINIRCISLLDRALQAAGEDNLWRISVRSTSFEPTDGVVATNLRSMEPDKSADCLLRASQVVNIYNEMCTEGKYHLSVQSRRARMSENPNHQSQQHTSSYNTSNLQTSLSSVTNPHSQRNVQNKIHTLSQRHETTHCTRAATVLQLSTEPTSFLSLVPQPLLIRRILPLLQSEHLPVSYTTESSAQTQTFPHFRPRKTISLYETLQLGQGKPATRELY